MIESFLRTFPTLTPNPRPSGASTQHMRVRSPPTCADCDQGRQVAREA
jgi:hypothetical protein